MKFIESMRLENGEVLHLDLHQRRSDLTTLAHFGRSIQHDLRAALSDKNLPAVGLYKIRLTYGTHIEGIDIESYARRIVRGVQLVDARGLDYRYKYADRAALMALKAGLADGVEPILVQDGVVTDGTYANVCFYNGESWLTPERPLLQGIARTVALEAGAIFPAQILAGDVRAGRYSRVKLINCMNWFQESQEIILSVVS